MWYFINYDLYCERQTLCVNFELFADPYIIQTSCWRLAAECKFKTHFEWLCSKIPPSVGPVLPSWSLLSINEKRAALTRGRLPPGSGSGKEEMERGKLLRYFFFLAFSFFSPKIDWLRASYPHNCDLCTVRLILLPINRYSFTAIEDQLMNVTISEIANCIKWFKVAVYFFWIHTHSWFSLISIKENYEEKKIHFLQKLIYSNKQDLLCDIIIYVDCLSEG